MFLLRDSNYLTAKFQGIKDAITAYNGNITDMNAEIAIKTHQHVLAVRLEEAQVHEVAKRIEIHLSGTVSY
jgi:hypothetical protein